MGLRLGARRSGRRPASGSRSTASSAACPTCRRDGIRALGVGLGLFVAFGLFFEGVIGLSGEPFLVGTDVPADRPDRRSAWSSSSWGCSGAAGPSQRCAREGSPPDETRGLRPLAWTNVTPAATAAHGARGRGRRTICVRTGILSPPGPTPARSRPSRHRSSGGLDMLRRSLRASLLSLLLLVVAASSAFAHECYNASRSAQGNTGAQHSDNWFNLTVEFVFTAILPEEYRHRAHARSAGLGPRPGRRGRHPSGLVIRSTRRIGFTGKWQARPGLREARRRRPGHRPRRRGVWRPALRDLLRGVAAALTRRSSQIFDAPAEPPGRRLLRPATRSRRSGTPSPPRGVATLTVSPTLRPMSARPTGDTFEIRPAAGSASAEPTIR